MKKLLVLTGVLGSPLVLALSAVLLPKVAFVLIAFFNFITMGTPFTTSVFLPLIIIGVLSLITRNNLLQDNQALALIL